MEQLTVALPERAYDIIMERGLLQQVGQQCREVLKPGCRVAVVTDSNVAIQYGLPGAGVPEPGGLCGQDLPGARRGALQKPGGAHLALGRAVGLRPDPQRRCGRPGGRHGGGPGWVRRRHGAAWGGFHPDPHHPPGTGGLFGRRQGGHRPEGRQEPGRCLLAAQTGAHGPGRAGQPVR